MIIVITRRQLPYYPRIGALAVSEEIFIDRRLDK